MSRSDKRGSVASRSDDGEGARWEKLPQSPTATAPSGMGPLAWRYSFRLKRKASGFGSHPFRHRLRRCHLPQGDGFSGGGKVYGIAIRRPLGGAGCERSEQTEGVLSRSAALSQKAALQMPFSSTTPPVKRQFWKIRRFSRIAKFKIIFPLKMRKANAERIQNRPPPPTTKID